MNDCVYMVEVNVGWLGGEWLEVNIGGECWEVNDWGWIFVG